MLPRLRPALAVAVGGVCVLAASLSAGAASDDAEAKKPSLVAVGATAGSLPPADAAMPAPAESCPDEPRQHSKYLTELMDPSAFLKMVHVSHCGDLRDAAARGEAAAAVGSEFRRLADGRSRHLAGLGHKEGAAALYEGATQSGAALKSLVFLHTKLSLGDETLAEGKSPPKRHPKPRNVEQVFNYFIDGPGSESKPIFEKGFLNFVLKSCEADKEAFDDAMIFR